MDDDVKVAETVNGLMDHRLSGLVVGNRAAVDHGLAAEGANGGLRFLGRAGVNTVSRQPGAEIVDDDFCTIGRQ